MNSVSYDSIRNIITNSRPQSYTHDDNNDNIVHEAIRMIINKEYGENLDMVRNYFRILNEERGCNINIEHSMGYLNDIEFMICEENKIYNLDPLRKAYCVSGQLVTLCKRYKLNQDNLSQDQLIRESFVNELQSAITKLFLSGRYQLAKFQQQHSLSDILLQFHIPSNNFQPVYLGNQIFGHCLSIGPSIIMTIPDKINKSINIDFIKNSLLRVYLSQSNLLDKLIIKEMVYRNSKIQGVYFIDQGQFEVSSGRIVARGWITKGTCKNSGYVWKFKPINFFKFIAVNDNILKQYLTDIKNNEEYPINVNWILSLNEQDYLETNVDHHHHKVYARQSLKLPKIMQQQSQSVDSYKVLKIEKLRHYDDKIDDIFSHKQDILKRKMKGKVHKYFERLVEYQSPQQKKETRLQKFKRDLTLKNKIIPQSKKNQSQSNILIMSVLRRLQSMASDEDQDKQERQQIHHYQNNRSKLPIQLYRDRRKRPYNKFINK